MSAPQATADQSSIGVPLLNRPSQPRTPDFPGRCYYHTLPMSSSAQKLRIIVGGLVGQYPLGGVAWDYFHYVLGLHELGHDVYYDENTNTWPYDAVKQQPSDDGTVNAR